VEPPPAAKQEPTPFQKFDALMRRIIKVPKAVVDRRAIEDKKERQRQKRATPL
jgi:hypothetical protein